MTTNSSNATLGRIVGCTPPLLRNDPAEFVQSHRIINNVTKQAFSILHTERYKIGTNLPIVEIRQSHRTPPSLRVIAWH